MRSAFASCYNSMVGIRHIGERGFVQEKHYSRTSSESDFVRGFLHDTSLCDTVIVTSSGLFEIDAGLCPRASTEELVGELVRRLSYALMEPKILDRIVGPSRHKTEAALLRTRQRHAECAVRAAPALADDARPPECIRLRQFRSLGRR